MHVLCIIVWPSKFYIQPLNKAQTLLWVFSQRGSWHGEMSGARVQCSVSGHRGMTSLSQSGASIQTRGPIRGRLSRRPVNTSRGIDPSADQYLEPGSGHSAPSYHQSGGQCSCEENCLIRNVKWSFSVLCPLVHPSFLRASSRLVWMHFKNIDVKYLDMIRIKCVQIV